MNSDEDEMGRRDMQGWWYRHCQASNPISGGQRRGLKTACSGVHDPRAIMGRDGSVEVWHTDQQARQNGRRARQASQLVRF